MPRLASLALLLVACAPKAPEVKTLAQLAEEQDYRAVPRQPPEQSEVYARMPARSGDPILAALTEGVTWDAALSGAAGAMGLGIAQRDRGLTRWELREAMWRAGYPYPVSDARAWTVPLRNPPAPATLAWIEAREPEEDVGLVRVRGPSEEVWVGLTGRPRVTLPAQPRQVEPGTALRLPAIPQASFHVADGAGHLVEEGLDEGATLLMTVPGEWLVVLDDGDGELARFPLFVGVPAREEPLLAAPASDLIGADDPIARAATLLDHVRNTWERPRWLRAALLDAAAQRVLADRSQPLEATLAGLGYAGVQVSLLECRGSTVEDCLDKWVWIPSLRSLLLDARDGDLGLAGEVDTRGVHLVALVAPG